MTLHTSISLRISFLLVLAGNVRPVDAQTADRKWELEFHAGGMFSTNSTAGTLSLPGAGETFTTAGIYPPPAPQVIVVSASRRQSSWYFADGPILFAQAATSLAANPVAMTAPFAQRIVTLDPVLGRSLGEMRSSGSTGARLSRTLTPRLTAELSVDYRLSRIEITPANSDSIEATRESFHAAFNGLITSNTGRTLRNLSSTATLDVANAHQLQTTGALLVNLNTMGAVTPYVIVGASLVSIIGGLPNAVLTGNYQFVNASGAVFDETDNVSVRDARDTQSVAAVLGGGVKYHFSPRWGIRFDARISLGENTGVTVVDASPNLTLGQAPAGRSTLNSNPTIQFGNSTAPVTSLGVTGLAPSTLSGPAITGHRTWSGSGVARHTNIAAGVFWRF